MSFHVFGIKYSILIDIRELRTTMNHLMAGNPRPARGTQRLDAFPVASGLDPADGDAAAVRRERRAPRRPVLPTTRRCVELAAAD
jgi:hypothetical protein